MVWQLVRDPVAVESVRDPAGQADASHRVTLEVRSIDDDQLTAVGYRVVDVSQVPAGELVGLPDGRCEHRLAWRTRRSMAAVGAEPVLGRGITLQVIADQRAATDGHGITGGRAGQPVVDARELHTAVVELALLHHSGVQVDAPTPQLGSGPELAAVAPHLRVAEDFQHN